MSSRQLHWGMVVILVMVIAAKPSYGQGDSSLFEPLKDPALFGWEHSPGVSDGATDLEGTANPSTSSTIQAVVDWCGPVHITQGPVVLEDDPCQTNIGALSQTYGGEAVPYFYWTYAWGVFLGGSLTDPATHDQAVQAPPLTYIDISDPPCLIMHGGIDSMVPIAQSELLADALEAARVDVTFIRLPNTGHGYWGSDEPMLSDFLTPRLEFFDANWRNN